ncbi:bifunctional metallophosphatase/5'-nucleotidase [Saliphagus sp. GCM10025317]
MAKHPRRKNCSSSEHDSLVDRSRRRFLGATAGASLAALVPASASVVASGETVTIVHDTHFHGRFRNAQEYDLNIARYYTVVEDVLDDAENSLFLGNGDDIAPSMLGLEYEGEHMIEALNYMDIDAVGVGNHEYDFGADIATTRFEESEFPWLVANLLDDAGDPVPGTERWTTLEEGGLTVGVFGLVSTNFHSLTDYPAEWQVLGYVEGAQEAVDALRADGADVVVCASHVSTGIHDTLAAEVDGLDAIVGSHSGVVYDEPEIADGTVVSEFGDEFAHVGSITLDADGDLVDWRRVDLIPENWSPSDAVDEYEQITARETADIEEDPTLVDLAEEWQGELDERLGQPFFESETDLNGTFDNYAIETGFGNLITDAMATIGDTADIEVDVAVQNGGGIRGGYYEAGPITGAQVMETLPFPNEIEVVELTGQQLVDYLESEIRPHPSEDYGTQPAIQVSGVSYEWWGHDEETWIDNVFVGGEPVDLGATYYMANNDYVVGNDPILSEAKTVLESGQFQGPYVLDVLEEWGTVAPERENRMIRVDEDVGAGSVARDDGEIAITVPFPEGGTAVVEDSFRAMIRTGEDLAAESVAEGDDTVEVVFDAEALCELASSVENPVLRVFGGYDPDEEYWGYGFELPTSSGYDYFKLKSSVDAAAVLETGEGADGDDGDDGEDDDGGNGNGEDQNGDQDGDDQDGDEQENEDVVDEDTDVSGEEDGMPGFGPFAALAGGAGGTYLYSRVRGADDEESDRA